MRRTAIIISWLLCMGGAYLLGLQHAPTSEVRKLSPMAYDAHRLPAVETTRIAQAAPFEQSRSALAQALELIATGQPEAAIPLLNGYLEQNADDARALFALSDALQMTGQSNAAYRPLFAVLRFPPSEEDARRARRRVDLLVNAREQQLLNAQDYAALVRFFEFLTFAEPGYDGHRLALARWSLRTGDVDEAERLLKQTGNVGATDEQIAALGEEIRLQRTTLPIERSGGSLYTEALIGSARVRGQPGRMLPIRLLIDTGATMTSLSAQWLQRSGAARQKQLVNVRTANGVVKLAVYRIAELQIGSLSFGEMDVLALEELPGDADGLLGMDVLSRLPKPVGRP